MVLIVDFNMREPDGRIPALLLAGSAQSLMPGDAVVASDGEGIQCNAVVSEISPDRRYAMLKTTGRARRHYGRLPNVSSLFAGESRA